MTEHATMIEFSLYLFIQGFETVFLFVASLADSTNSVDEEMIWLLLMIMLMRKICEGLEEMCDTLEDALINDSRFRNQSWRRYVRRV